MKSLKVTKLEAKVLENLSQGMYAEAGFSDVGPTEVEEGTGIEMRVLRGVLGSLEKKGYINIDHRESEGYKNKPEMHIIYLCGGAEGLVEHWVGESIGWDFNDSIEEAELVINS